MPLPIRFISHDVLTPVAAEHQVVDRARKLDSKRARHCGNLPLYRTQGNLLQNTGFTGVLCKPAMALRIRVTSVIATSDLRPPPA
jgi:hypothetical protein